MPTRAVDRRARIEKLTVALELAALTCQFPLHFPLSPHSLVVSSLYLHVRCSNPAAQPRLPNSLDQAQLHLSNG